MLLAKSCINYHLLDIIIISMIIYTSVINFSQLQNSNFPSLPCPNQDVVDDITSKLNNISVEDIDAEDKENPLLCSEYITDIYAYMRKMEITYHVSDSNKAIYFQYLDLISQFTPRITAPQYIKYHLPRFTHSVSIAVKDAFWLKMFCIIYY